MPYWFWAIIGSASWLEDPILDESHGQGESRSMELKMLSGRDAVKAANVFALGVRRVQRARVSQEKRILCNASTSTRARSSTAESVLGAGRSCGRRESSREPEANRCLGGRCLDIRSGQGERVSRRLDGGEGIA